MDFGAHAAPYLVVMICEDSVWPEIGEYILASLCAFLSFAEKSRADALGRR